MYIEDQNRRASSEKMRSVREEHYEDDFENERLESPHDFLISEHSKDVLAHWRGPEYETYERDKRWYVTMSIILLAIISWAVFTNSPVMAITFILLGVVGYIHTQKEPREIDFMITHDGIVTDRELYEYDHLKSFWIIYEPEGKKVVSFHTQSSLLPFVQIPIFDENPVQIRDILLQFLPEVKHEEGLTELLERILRF